ncbi:MAG TPA: GNAT family N-acetyltransferase, partial [Kofleriaceae bacterium]|nr:GNAT family N-acetyltransferase [Kofleriaceae bacterium]
IDNRGVEGRISIALPAHARGRQIGRRAIEAACRAYGTPVIAEIHRSNHPSRAAFEACGFQLVGVDADRSLYRWTPEIV